MRKLALASCYAECQSSSEMPAWRSISASRCREISLRCGLGIRCFNLPRADSQPQPGDGFAIVDLQQQPFLKDFPELLAAIFQVFRVGPHAFQAGDFTKISAILQQFVLRASQLFRDICTQHHPRITPLPLGVSSSDPTAIISAFISRCCVRWLKRAQAALDRHPSNRKRALRRS